MTQPKQPYTGPSQVVTTDTRRNLYVDVYMAAKRMTLYAGVYRGGQPVMKSNLNPENHPGLWAVVHLLRDPAKDVSAGRKFYVRLTFQELEAADEGLAAWVREESTKALFEKGQQHERTAKLRIQGSIGPLF